ncbi:tetratricopeptide repeat protein [Acinetobacter sp. P1(2025)]|uniref:tetratricopeptide repeat protein n=1 Tax=Acinetobacter sp. P1(2025) TaxID=3446120 RepID=UPI003F52A904
MSDNNIIQFPNSDLITKKLRADYFEVLERDDPMEMFEWGRKFFLGLEVPLNFEMANTLYTKSAEARHAEAQFLVGMNNLIGDGVDQNIAKAIYWLNQAAEQGQVNAQYLLTEIYTQGQYIKPDFPKAVYWLERLTQTSDHEIAPYILAQIYQQGVHVPKDLKKAINLYIQSANLGFTMAQYDLAKFYLSGYMVEKNVDQALFWLGKSMRTRNPEAEYLLATLYESGQEVEKDMQKAMQLYQHAADMGHIPSLNRMNEFNRVNLSRASDHQASDKPIDETIRALFGDNYKP